MLRIVWIIIAVVFIDAKSFAMGHLCKVDRDTLKTSSLSELQWIKKEGDNVYITSKLDMETDIQYWFKKCMFNELFTFYRVAIMPNKQIMPTHVQDSSSMTLLNLSYSDNIGPLDVSGIGFCGGNHSYNDSLKTAENRAYRVFVDGVELKQDTSGLVSDIEISVINHILNPKEIINSDSIALSNHLLCVEKVNYRIKRNNIQVSVQLEYCNREPVIIKRYYGMQSMFKNETEVLTANGPYYNWTPVSNLSRFTKKEYPHFNRFIEKNSSAYQASYLLDNGLGNHQEISDIDLIFIGNSSGKNYHKLMAEKERKRGDMDSWSGIYTWFRKPLRDDEQILCYEGTISGKQAIYIDCKTKGNLSIPLPSIYGNRRFSIVEKMPGIHISSKRASSEIKITSEKQGSCIIVFKEK